MKNNTVPEQFEDLANQIGSFIEYWGFKKIHGQIWTHVWLSDHPIDATTLVKRLKVSKALISLAVKDLIHYDVIRIVGQGDRRKILLETNPDVQTVIGNVLRQRESKMLEAIMNSCENAAGTAKDTKALMNIHDGKLEAMKIMIQVAQMSLASMLDSQLNNETNPLI